MIAVLDFGSQYTHLIARRVRELGVKSEIFPHDVAVSALSVCDGIIMSGGPNTVNDASALIYDKKIFDLGKPVLGLCYSHQLIGHHFGGKVFAGTTSEFGRQEVNVDPVSPLFRGMLQRQVVWMSHADSVQTPPMGFSIIGSSADCPNVAMANVEKKIYSTQFHIEVQHTQNGMAILNNFLFGICDCAKDWNTRGFLREISDKILKQAKDRKVLLLVSGGVDSSVCFALLNKTLGTDRVRGVHIDTGFMRKGESHQIIKAMREAGFENLEVVNASKRFFAALAGITDPEQKRQVIGDLYLEVKDEVIENMLGNNEEWVLAQGTIYPDTIESGGTKAAHKIKTHHNRVPKLLGLIEQGNLIEPLADLYKDEVRELGRELGLSSLLINRQPFPGPGLAIRMLCSDGVRPAEVASAEVEKKIDAVLSQCNASAGSDLRGDFLPLRSVGVQGDFRTYRHPAVIQGRALWPALDVASSAITNAVRETNRVLWLISPERADFSDAQLLPTTLTPQRTQLLQEIDDVVQSFTREAGIEPDIWQFPVVLVPFGTDGKESIVLRPFQSRDAMTLNVYHMDLRLLAELVARLQQFSQYISFIFYDLTHKPPGTVEWE